MKKRVKSTLDVDKLKTILTGFIAGSILQLLVWLAPDMSMGIKLLIALIVGIIVYSVLTFSQKKEQRKIEEELNNLIESLSNKALKAFKEQGMPARLRQKYLERLVDESMKPNEITKQNVIDAVRARIEEIELDKFMEAEAEESNKRRQPIPSSVRDEVWRRDQGKCVKCGSREKLEFDHIVPVSKGGSNTARNIELLCEKCNRSKSSNIN